MWFYCGMYVYGSFPYKHEHTTHVARLRYIFYFKKNTINLYFNIQDILLYQIKKSNDNIYSVPAFITHDTLQLHGICLYMSWNFLFIIFIQSKWLHFLWHGLIKLCETRNYHRCTISMKWLLWLRYCDVIHWDEQDYLTMGFGVSWLYGPVTQHFTA